MPLKTSKYIWHEGKLVPWEQATVHVLSHALHYGSSVFEGIRVYKTPHGRRGLSPDGPRAAPLSTPRRSTASRFRTRSTTLVTACRDVVRENGLLGGAYIRPIAFRGYGEMGVAGNIEQPASVSVAAWEWGSYLGEGGLDQGVDVCVSSWQRVAPNTVPALAKAGGNYLSSALVTLEARRLGFTEGLALEHGGVRQRRRRRESVLDPGRQALHAARRLVDPVRHHAQHGHAARRSRPASPCSSRTFRASCSYIADEVFLTGTAAEITPVRSVDKIPVGEGKRGPITEQLQKLFFGLFDGSTADRWNWLEPIVDQKAGRTRPVAV